MRIWMMALFALLALARPAAAHPHVWVTVKSDVVYGDDGMLTGIRQAWTFDKAYSAYSTQGLDKNGDGKFSPEELQELARVNAEGLSEFGYFTHAKVNGKALEFASPREPAMDMTDGMLTLRFLLPLTHPIKPGKAMMLEVSDPTYFVAFSLSEASDAVRLVQAPKGCTLTTMRPKEEAPKDQSVAESFFSALDQSSDFGSQFANKTVIACP